MHFLYKSPALAAGLAALTIFATNYDQAAADNVACESYVAGHQLTGNGAAGSHSFLDGRVMKGTTYQVGGCGHANAYPTGRKFEGNYTFLSYDEPVTNDKCLVKKAGNKGVYSSYQATVFEAVGYRWTPEISVDDLDALPTTNKYDGRTDTWRESGLVFGISDGKVVYPELSFSPGTFLKRKTYTVTKESLAEMGLGNLGDIDVVGSEFADDKPLFNCPFSGAGVSSRCRMTVKFTQPIHKMVVLYAAAEKSMQDPNAAMFISELRLPCMCMCSSEERTGVIYSEDPDKPGKCVRAEETEMRERTRCDMLGTAKVCEYEYKETFQRKGPMGPDGFYPCGKVMGPTMIREEPYSP